MKDYVFYFQLALAFAISFALFLGLGLLNNPGSGSVLKILLFQTVYALLFGIVSLLVCGIMGLPIRLNESVYQWWIARPWLGPLILVGGLLICLLSVLPGFRQEISDPGVAETRILPHPYLAMAGWALSGFGAMHWYPGKKLSGRIEKLLNRKQAKKADEM